MRKLTPTEWIAMGCYGGSTLWATFFLATFAAKLQKFYSSIERALPDSTFLMLVAGQYWYLTATLILITGLAIHFLPNEKVRLIMYFGVAVVLSLSPFISGFLAFLPMWNLSEPNP